MNADYFNGMFGRIDPGNIRLDVNGNIAVRTTNGYKSYNMKTGKLINCNNFVFDIGEEFFFVIPTNKVEKGDIILAQSKGGGRKPKCVIDVNSSFITVINYEDSTVEQILPERHMFYGNTYFYGKIVSMLNFSKGKHNGFKNILKYKMISEMMGDKNIPNPSPNSNSSPNSNPNNMGNAMGNFMGNLMMFSMMGENNFSDMFNFEEMFDFDDDTDTEEDNQEDEE